MWTAAKFNVLALGSIGVLFLIFAPTIVRLFTTAPEVARVAVYGLRVIGLGFPVYALGMVFEQSFNGAGDTRTPTWINFFCFWIVQIPLAWALSSLLGLQERGVFIAVPVAYAVLALVSTILFRRGEWKTQVV